MNDIKRRKAEYLFDELGEIDDRMVAEAMNTKAFNKKQTERVIVRSLAFAAAAVIVTGLSLGLLLSQTLQTGDKDEGAAEEELVMYQSISDALCAAERENLAERFDSADAVELFDSNVKIIWQSRDSGSYYALSLDARETGELTKALEKTYFASQIADESDLAQTHLWISYGDGRVVSPYLKESAGNVGYGELFEYSPEIIPSEEFLELVNSLVLE